MSGIRLLHLSDIHFSGYEGTWDYDQDVRTELLLDLERLLAGGSLDGILVGGDVAYSALGDEYSDAGLWLKQVCDAGGCRQSLVWTVPGNHDIDWGRIRGSAIVQEFHAVMRGCDVNEIDAELRKRLHDDEHGDVLLGPLDNYNTFALPYGCQSTKSALAWEDMENLRLGRLRVHLLGVNSALVSDESDPREPAQCLVLGRAQCQIERAPETVRIVLCHHPPKWIRDWDTVGPYLRSRAHLIFYGHEHTFAARQLSEGVVEIFAGAVHPERGETWVPSYNLVDLELNDDDLGVRVLARQWDPEKTEFAGASPEIYDFLIRMAPVDREPTAESDSSEPGTSEEPGRNEEVRESPTEQVNTSEHKDLFFRFLDLPRSTRMSIAARLELLEGDDRTLPDHQLFPALLRRAEERRLIEQLAKEVLSVSRS